MNRTILKVKRSPNKTAHQEVRNVRFGRTPQKFVEEINEK